MKILYVGNLANLSYNYAKFLRKENVKVDLFMNNNTIETSKPSYIIEEVPKWVHYYKHKSKILNFFEIYNEAKKYKIVQAFYSTAIPLQFSNRPYIIYATGSDFRELAQQNTLFGRLMERAFRKADLFLCSQIDMIDIINKQNYDNVEYIPVPVDIPEKKEFKHKGDEIIILYPTNHYWYYKDGKDLKRNDIFLKGLAMFIKSTKKKVKCLVFKRGDDYFKSLRLILDLGIRENIVVMNEVSQIELLKLMWKSDIVADQFGLGSFGMIALEAMALKKPVLISINKKLEKEFYGENSSIPELNTPEKICEYLKYLVKNNHMITEGKKNYNFVNKYHNGKVVAKRLKKIYESYQFVIDYKKYGA